MNAINTSQKKNKKQNELKHNPQIVCKYQKRNQIFIKIQNIKKDLKKWQHKQEKNYSINSLREAKTLLKEFQFN